MGIVKPHDHVVVVQRVHEDNTVKVLSVDECGAAVKRLSFKGGLRARGEGGAARHRAGGRRAARAPRCCVEGGEAMPAGQGARRDAARLRLLSLADASAAPHQCAPPPPAHLIRPAELQQYQRQATVGARVSDDGATEERS